MREMPTLIKTTICLSIILVCLYSGLAIFCLTASPTYVSRRVAAAITVVDNTHDPAVLQQWLHKDFTYIQTLELQARVHRTLLAILGGTGALVLMLHLVILRPEIHVIGKKGTTQNTQAAR